MELKGIFIMGGEVMNLLLYRFFRTQIYGILMFYVKDLQKQHRKRNLVAWRLMALVWILDTGYYYIVQGQFLFSDFLFCGANGVLCSVFCGSTMFLGSFYLPGVWKTNFFSTAGVRSLSKV